MIIKATFTGTNSLGYETDENYLLIVKNLTIKRADNTGECKYDSLHAFLNNWNNITIR